MKILSITTTKSLQLCPTLCDPIDGSPPGYPVPGILQARTLEWVAISFSNAWKWKWSRSVVSDPQRPHGLQPSRLLHPWDFPGKSTGVGCHCLLRILSIPTWKRCAVPVLSGFKNYSVPCVFQSLSRVQLFVTPWTPCHVPCPSPSPRVCSN